MHMYQGHVCIHATNMKFPVARRTVQRMPTPDDDNYNTRRTNQDCTEKNLTPWHFLQGFAPKMKSLKTRHLIIFVLLLYLSWTSGRKRCLRYLKIHLFFLLFFIFPFICWSFLLFSPSLLPAGTLVRLSTPQFYSLLKKNPNKSSCNRLNTSWLRYTFHVPFFHFVANNFGFQKNELGWTISK